MTLHGGMTLLSGRADMGALQDQTALNIREWGGRRKQQLP